MQAYTYSNKQELFNSIQFNFNVLPTININRYHITVISASPSMLEILSKENFMNIKHHKIGNATENVGSR